MPRLQPDHVATRVLTSVETLDQPEGDHPFEVALFYLVKNASSLQPDVDEAFCLYENHEQRHVLNAAILAKAPDALLQAEIDLPPGVAAAYRYLFFDRGVFRHALDVASYVAGLELDKKYKEIYETAIQQGADVLLMKYHIGPRAPIDPKDVIRHTLSTFYERAQAHRGQQITSKAAKEALKWGRAAVSTAATLIDKGNNQAEAALKDLKLALEIKDHTKTPADLGVSHDEIVGG